MKKILDLTPHIDPAAAEGLKKQPVFDYGEITDFEKFRKLRATPPTPAPEDVNITNLTIPGYPDGEPDVTVRVYTNANSPSEDTMVWIHGGGFVVGDVYENDILCILSVRSADCNVVSVDYRLAPEHPFPAATNDCYAALLWAASGPEALGGKQRQILVGGASAGGCHAAGLALMARDLGGPSICHQLLFVPVIDDRLETRSSMIVHDPRVWNREKSAACWKLYLGENSSDDVSPYASPARAKDLSGLPSATVFAAEMDLLRDEAVDYANRLTAADVRTDLIVYAGTIHGHNGVAPESYISQRMARDALEAMRFGFGKPALG